MTSPAIRSNLPPALALREEKINRLLARIDQLEGRISELESKFIGAPEERLRIQVRLGLSHSEAMILQTIYNRPAVTGIQIHAALYAGDPEGGPDIKIIHVFLHHIKYRRGLRKRGIVIKGMKGGFQGHGYYSMSPESKRVLRNILDEEWS